MVTSNFTTSGATAQELANQYGKPVAGVNPQPSQAPPASQGMATTYSNVIVGQPSATHVPGSYTPTPSEATALAQQAGGGATQPTYTQTTTPLGAVKLTPTGGGTPIYLPPQAVATQFVPVPTPASTPSSPTTSTTPLNVKGVNLAQPTTFAIISPAEGQPSGPTTVGIKQAGSQQALQNVGQYSVQLVPDVTQVANQYGYSYASNFPVGTTPIGFTNKQGQIFESTSYVAANPNAIAQLTAHEVVHNVEPQLTDTQTEQIAQASPNTFLSTGSPNLTYAQQQALKSGLPSSAVSGGGAVTVIPPQASQNLQSSINASIKAGELQAQQSYGIGQREQQLYPLTYSQQPLITNLRSQGGLIGPIEAGFASGVQGVAELGQSLITVPLRAVPGIASQVQQTNQARDIPLNVPSLVATGFKELGASTIQQAEANPIETGVSIATGALILGATGQLVKATGIGATEEPTEFNVKQPVAETKTFQIAETGNEEAGSIKIRTTTTPEYQKFTTTTKEIFQPEKITANVKQASITLEQESQTGLIKAGTKEFDLGTGETKVTPTQNEKIVVSPSEGIPTVSPLENVPIKEMSSAQLNARYAPEGKAILGVTRTSEGVPKEIAIARELPSSTSPVLPEEFSKEGVLTHELIHAQNPTFTEEQVTALTPKTILLNEGETKTIGVTRESIEGIYPKTEQPSGSMSTGFGADVIKNAPSDVSNADVARQVQGLQLNIEGRGFNPEAGTTPRQILSEQGIDVFPQRAYETPYGSPQITTKPVTPSFTTAGFASIGAGAVTATQPTTQGGLGGFLAQTTEPPSRYATSYREETTYVRPEITNQITNQLGSLGQGLTIGQNLVQLQPTTQATSQTPAQTLGNTQIQDPIQTQIISQQPAQAQQSQQIQIQTQQPRTSQQFQTTGIPFEFPLPFSTQTKKGAKQKQTRRGSRYQAYTRRFGKEIRIGLPVESKGLAERLGIARTTADLSRTVIVKNIETGRIEPVQTVPGFRRSKRRGYENVIVETNPLSSSSEVGKIQSYRKASVGRFKTPRTKRTNFNLEV